MTLGEKILQLRKKNGITQEQLAEKLSVSRQAVSKWELSESRPDIEYVVKISTLFNTSLDYLLKDELTAEPDEPNKKPKKRKRLLYSSAIILLVSFGVFVGYLLGGGFTKQAPKQAPVSVFAQEDKLVADFTYYRAGIASDYDYSFDLTVIPSVYNENITAKFLVISGMETTTYEAKNNEGTAFSASVSIPKYYQSKISVIFDDGTGQYTQGLLEIINIKDDSCLSNVLWQ